MPTINTKLLTQLFSFICSLEVHAHGVGVRVPEHLSGGSGAIVGQLWGGGQGRVGHLLDVGVRGRRLGRFLLAECLFERAAQLQRDNKNGQRW